MTIIANRLSPMPTTAIGKPVREHNGHGGRCGLFCPCQCNARSALVRNNANWDHVETSSSLESQCTSHVTMLRQALCRPLCSPIRLHTGCLCVDDIDEPTAGTLVRHDCAASERGWPDASDAPLGLPCRRRWRYSPFRFGHFINLRGEGFAYAVGRYSAVASRLHKHQTTPGVLYRWKPQT